MFIIEVPKCVTCGAVQNSSGAPKSGKLVEKVSTCLCYMVGYCSVECQKADWPKHKLTCLTKKETPPIYKKIAEQFSMWKGNSQINMQYSPYPELIGSFDRRQWWGKFAKYFNSPVQPYLREFASLGQNKKVLDLGSGLSLTPCFLLEKGYQVHCVDYSLDALSVAQSHLARINKQWIMSAQVIFICADIPHFEWQSDYDIVYAGSSLSYFNPKKMHTIITQIEKCLKVGGFFVGNITAKCLANEILQEIEYNMGHWLIDNQNSVQELLEAHHFEIIKIGNHKEANPNSISFIAKKTN